MSAGRGQALRVLHHCGRGALLLFVLLAFGLSIAAWRLAESPMVSPWLAARLIAAADRELAPARLEIGAAAIGWGGWQNAAAPFELRLTELRLRDAAGTLRASVPEAEVGLSLPALLRGRLAPASVELTGPSLLLRRDADGRFGLDLGSPALTEEAAPPEATESEAAALLAALLGATDGPIASLRSVRLRGGTLMVADALPGRRFTLGRLALDANREAAGALVATGSARLRGGTLDLPVRVRARADATGVAVGLELPALRPAELVPLLPEAASLAGFGQPVAIAVDAQFDAALAARSLTLRLGLAGDAAPGGPDAATATVVLVPGGVRLEAARLAFGGGAAVVSASGGARTEPDGRWSGTVDLALAPLEAAQLAAAWPAGMAPAWRDRVAATLPRGRLGGTAQVSLAADAALALPRVVAATGRVTLEDAAVALGEGAVPVAAAELGVALEADTLRLTAGRLRLADAPDGGVGPTVTLAGGATRADGVWRGTVEARLDALPITGLSHWWPPGIQRAERSWFTGNVTAGIVRNGFWRLQAAAQADAPLAVEVTALEGRAEWSDATVHWLRPVPPAVGASGTAEFGLDTITVRGGNAQQLNAEGRPSGIVGREATVRFLELDTRPGRMEMAVEVAGPLPEVATLLRHPRLKLFEKRPLGVQPTGGRATGRVVVGFPLWNDLPAEDLAIRVTGRLIDARIANALLGRDLEAGQLSFEVDTEALAMRGEARLAGLPLRLTLGMDFKTGGPTQVIERATVTTTADAPALARLGFDPGGWLDGPAAITAEARKQRDGDARVVVRADLGRARLALPPIGWSKPAGAAASAEATLRLRDDTLAGAEAVRLQAPDLLVRGGLAFAGGGGFARAELSEIRLGATRASGEVVAPSGAEPWRVRLRGALLDLGPVLEADRGTSGEPDPALDLDLRFERVRLGPGRDLHGVVAHGRTDAAGVVRDARLAARTAASGGAVAASLAAAGAGRELRLTAEDAGGLLRAFDVTEALRGGRLSVEGSYSSDGPGAPLAGTATLDGFSIRDAPAAGKLLQALSIYGVVEAMQGDGLLFSRAIVPFTVTPEALAINDARAYSASLGLTARGRVLRGQRTLDVEGTIVPAYALNAALGNIPVLGRLFSAERGGGLFAATWRLAGPMADPSFSLNPLSALTPGFLRGLFGAPDPTRGAVVETPRPLE